MATPHPQDAQQLGNPGGRPPALKPEHLAVLREIVAEGAPGRLQEVVDELHSRCGVQVCAATISRSLRAMGLARSPPAQASHGSAHTSKTARPVTGTAAQHGGQPPCHGTSLTDAEWTLVADLFERAPGQRGTPVHYQRRDLVDACCYVLRTGCAWRRLPPTFPPWQAVYKAFVRWVRARAFERMQERLNEQWRQRLGKRTPP